INPNTDDEGNDHITDTQDADDEDVKAKSDEDDIYKYKIHVRKDEDEEMINAKVDDSGKGDDEITDAAKADAEKNLDVKDDAKTTKLPLSSSSLSVSLGFGDQFLKLSYDSSLSPFVLSVHVSMVFEPIVPTPIHESPLAATVTTLPPLSVSTTPYVPQQTTTPIPKPPTTTDAQIITIVVPESNALTVVELRVEKLEKDGVADTVKDQKRKHDDDEDDDDEDPLARPNHGKKTKRRRTKESESSKKPSTTKETPKGKASSKGSKTGKSAPAKEPVEEPIAEVVLDQPEQPRFNQMVSATKDPLTFNELLATPIDFSKLHTVHLLRRERRLDMRSKELKTSSLHFGVPLNMRMTKMMSRESSIREKGVYCGTDLNVKKLHGYCHLEETVVKISDQHLYKFKEGVLLLTLLWPLFLDRTLKSVRDEIHQRVLDFHLDYKKEMPKRKWTAIDQKRSGLMIELIDK
nr:hypothetical protein [Tanacetum cinerariifolium]